MPLTPKGKKIIHAMEKEYGEKKGKSVFYASKNKGTISGVEGGGRKAFKAGRTSGDYGTHKEHDELETKYRTQAAARAITHKMT